MRRFVIKNEEENAREDEARFIDGGDLINVA